jgi:serine/threonine protein phosphatase 1
MVAIIGDVHGCYYTLIDLYSRIQNEYPDITIYCVGDLVDRGNNSFEVMEFVMTDKMPFTPGNHDYMFHHFFKDPSSVFARSWVFNGSETTLESYESHQDSVFRHIEIINNAPLYYDLDDCFISHAGVSIKYELNLPENFREDLSILEKHIINDHITDRGVLWTRDSLLNLGKMQIVGHTKQQDITLDEKANALYIDTGACVGNKLSAVIVENSKLVDILDIKTNLNDII